jgi:hypothetical protein
VVTIEEIQHKYETAILRSQELYANRKVKDTAGAVRYTKGKIVEDITKLHFPKKTKVSLAL